METPPLQAVICLALPVATTLCARTAPGDSVDGSEGKGHRRAAGLGFFVGIQFTGDYFYIHLPAIFGEDLVKGSKRRDRFVNSQQNIGMPVEYRQFMVRVDMTRSIRIACRNQPTAGFQHTYHLR